MVRLGFKTRHRRTIGGQYRYGNCGEGEKHRSSKSISPGKKNSGLFRLFSTLAVCLSTFAIVFSVVKFREDGRQWSEIVSQLHYQELISEARHTTPSRRFPNYGTTAFAQQCNWTLKPMPLEPNCTIWATPHPTSNEGISEWASNVVKTYLQAKLFDCRFLIDYGPHIDIHQVLMPISDLRSGYASPAMNWTVPSGFDCSRRCNKYGYAGSKAAAPRVPRYRFAHWPKPKQWLNRSSFTHLEHALPGFWLESGMACSFGSLFQLSPRASQFEPALFTKILPALQDDKALVFSIYIRTGLTDVVAKREKQTEQKGEEFDPSKRFTSDSTVKCVRSLEQQHVKQNSKPGLVFSRIIWMVVTDSEDVKQWFTQKYSGQDVYLNISATKEQQRLPRVIKREILTTASHGIHTRAARTPSTAEFAEAMIDWYLIGESDLVIANGPSFGATGALRTARPYFDMHKCSLVEMVH